MTWSSSVPIRRCRVASWLVTAWVSGALFGGASTSVVRADPKSYVLVEAQRCLGRGEWPEALLHLNSVGRDEFRLVSRLDYSRLRSRVLMELGRYEPAQAECRAALDDLRKLEALGTGGNFQAAWIDLLTMDCRAADLVGSPSDAAPAAWVNEFLALYDARIGVADRLAILSELMPARPVEEGRSIAREILNRGVPAWQSPGRDVSPDDRRRSARALAEAYRFLGDVDQLQTLAEEIVQAAEDLAPADRLAYLRDAAESFARLGRYAAALEALEAAGAAQQSLVAHNAPAASAPEADLEVEAELTFRTAQLQHALGRRGATDETARRGVKLYQRLAANPTGDTVRRRLSCWTHLRDLYRLLDEIPTALAHAELLNELQQRVYDPADARLLPSRLALAELYLAAGDYGRATAVAGSHLDSAPPSGCSSAQYTALLLARSRALHRARRTAEGAAALSADLRAWSRSIEQDPSDLATLHLELAHYRAVTGQAQAAHQSLDEADDWLARWAERDRARPSQKPTAAPAPKTAADPRRDERLRLEFAVAYLRSILWESEGKQDRALENYRDLLRSPATGDEHAAATFACYESLARIYLQRTQAAVGPRRAAERTELVECLARARALSAADPGADARLDLLEGSLASLDGDSSQAVRLLERAVAAGGASDQSVLVAEARFMLAVTYQGLHQRLRADEQFRPALEGLAALGIAPGTRVTGLTARAENLRALIQELPDDPRRTVWRREAVEALWNAVEVLETPRAAMAGDEADRARYFARFAETYSLLIELLAEDVARLKANDERLGSAARPVSGGESEAFREAFFSLLYVIDQSQSRVLLDRLMLASGGAAVQQELHSQLTKNQYLDFQIRRVDGTPLGDPGRPLRWTAEGKADLRRLTESLKADDRAYQEAVTARAKKIGYAFIPFAAWRRTIERSMAPGHLLCVYSVGSTQSHVLVLLGRPEGLVSCDYLRLKHPIRSAAAAIAAAPDADVSRDSLSRLIDRYLHSPSDQRVGEALGAALFPQALCDLALQEEVRHLTWVRDGPLHRLPLEAVTYAVADGRFEYLFDRLRATTSYVHSLSTMRRLFDFPELDDACRTVLTVGLNEFSPAYGERAPQLKKGVASALHVAELFTKYQFVADDELTNQRATLAAVLDKIGRYRFRHILLATHADVDLSRDDLASIFFYDEAWAGTAVADCRIPSRGIVCAACKTAAGVDVRMEGPASLARAFLAAGCRNVVASQEPVEDFLANRFTETFYAQLLSHEEDYARAMQMTRRQMRDAADSAGDLRWIKFVLYGVPDEFHVRLDAAGN